MSIITKLKQNKMGLKVSISGHVGKLLSVANGEKFVFESDKGLSDTCKMFTACEVIELFGNTIKQVSEKKVNTFQEPLNCDDMKEFNRRTAYVQKIKESRNDGKIGGVIFLKDIIKRVSRDRNDKKPPSLMTLRGWYEASEDNVSGIKSTLNKKRNKRKSIFDDDVIALVLQCIDGYYLNLSRPTMQYAYDCYRSEHEKRFNLSKNFPSYKTFCNWVNELEHDEVTLKRHGKKALTASKRNKKGKHIGNHILERVEVDAVNTSMGIVDDKGNYLGILVIFFVLDCFSRAVLGYKIQIGTGENASSVIDSYRHALLPKDPTETSPNVKNTWPMAGLMETIISDGGPGYTANTSVNFLMEQGITWEVAQTGKGWCKPFIESFFGTLRMQFLQTLPSYCKRVKDSRELDLSLAQQAVFTVDDIENLLTEWIVDEYHQSIHSGLGNKTPHQVWLEDGGMHVMLPHNEQELQLLQGSLTSRTILGDASEAGIQVNRIAYNDAHGRIQEIGRSMKANGLTPVVDVQHNNNDVSQVTVFDEETGELLCLYANDPRIEPGMSLIQYKTSFPDKGYQDKGLGHNRVLKGNPIISKAVSEHEIKMQKSHRSTPRGAIEIDTLQDRKNMRVNTVELEITTDESFDLPIAGVLDDA